MIFESDDKKIRVVRHSAVGMKAFQNQMEIVRQDPNYSFLFEIPVSQNRIMAFIKGRIALLENDWDKSQTVFGSNQITESAGSELIGKE